MCQTQHSPFNDSFVMHPGLITGWIVPVMIVDSAPWYENLIAKHCLHHVAARPCKSPLFYQYGYIRSIGGIFFFFLN